MELLRTDALVIRPPVPEYASEAFDLLNDADVLRWNPGPACPDVAAAEAWLKNCADWSDGTHATWIAIDFTTSRLVGTTSLFAIDRNDLVARIGYRVLPHARGRGMARQMVRAVTKWAFDALGLKRVQIDHAVPNIASCRVAEAAGFAYEGTVRSAYARFDGLRDDCHIHGRLA